MSKTMQYSSEGFTAGELFEQLDVSRPVQLFVAKQREQAPNYLRTQYENAGMLKAADIIRNMALDYIDPSKEALFDAAGEIEAHVAQQKKDMEGWTQLAVDGVELAPLTTITILGGTDSPTTNGDRIVVLEGGTK